MGLTQKLDGMNPDGSPHLINTWTPLDGEATIHVIQTAAAKGPVTLDDGTTYDVTPPHIQVSEREGHVAAVCDEIEKLVGHTLTPLDR